MLIGQAKLISKQNTIYSALLQFVEFISGNGHYILNTSPLRKQRIAGKRPQMQQGNNRLFYLEHILSPHIKIPPVGIG